MRKLSFAFAAVALAAASAALADEKSKTGQQPTQTEQQYGKGGAGEAGMMQNEVVGEVVKFDEKNLYLKHMGAVIPLKIDKSTRFEGGLSKADLKEGQQVRASFTVQDNINNVATKIERASARPMEPGKGGAGEEPKPQPQEEDTY